MSVVAPGDVIRLFFQTTKPPKFKRCVVACLSPSPILLLINSEINDFINNRDELRSMQVLIDRVSHNFMDHDSWIDCAQLFGYPLDWIHASLGSDPRQRLGRISDATLLDIIKCVTETRLHSPNKKKQIIDGLTAPPESELEE